MPKLLSRSKYEEFELNSALQIINQKERRVENARKLELAGNLASCEILQLVKFRKLRNLLSACHCSCLLTQFTILLLFTSHTLQFDLLTPF